MRIPHPIPYQGSKRNLASQILPYIPDDTACFIEPFAGSAAMTLAIAQQNLAERYHINDINAPLMSLWAIIINRPEHVAQWYERLWHAQLGREREFYDWVRDRFNQIHRPHYFLYLLARCVKASVRYNANGDFNQSPDNRRKGRKPKTMSRDIIGASQLLQGKTTVTSVDYADLASTATPDDVIYFDPPYEGVSATSDPRYIRGMTRERFIRVLQQLNERDISYIVSYDGRTADKSFGAKLPAYLQLTHLELDAGRSSQATLLGRNAKTYESLYLSSALLARLPNPTVESPPVQLSLFEELS